MTALLGAASLVVAALGVATLVIGATAGRPLAALNVTLDLWIGAGLLKLSSATSGHVLAAIAATIVVRQIVLLRRRAVR